MKLCSQNFSGNHHASTITPATIMVQPSRRNHHSKTIIQACALSSLNQGRVVSFGLFIDGEVLSRACRCEKATSLSVNPLKS